MKSRPGLKWLHLTAGVLGIVAFLGTGQFMHHRLDHLAGMPDAPRALYRSAHIYILFAALLNLGIGAYVRAARAIVPRAIQYVGGALLVAALLSFLYGFFVETQLGLVERPTMRTGINWALWGVLLHTAAGLVISVRAPVSHRTGSAGRIEASSASAGNLDGRQTALLSAGTVE